MNMIYQVKWKDDPNHPDWEPLTEAEARFYARKFYNDEEAAIAEMRDGCHLEYPFMWIRYVAAAAAEVPL
jgi:hypothetical protein